MDSEKREIAYPHLKAIAAGKGEKMGLKLNL